MTNPEWDGLLDPGEVILWQGAPDPGLRIGFGQIASAAFGLLFAGFALFWMIGASRADGGFWAFGLIHFSVGVGIILGGLFWPTIRRRRTFYSLTNKRAFIATQLPFPSRSLKSYPITQNTVLDLIDGRFTSVHFATEFRRSKNGHREVPVGFEDLPDGRNIYNLLRQVQRGAAGGADVS